MQLFAKADGLLGKPQVLAGVIGHDDNLFARSGECYRQIRSAYNQLI